MNKRILLSSPTMHGDELGYVNEAFERNWIAPLGFNCDAFETEMGEYLSGEEKIYGLSLCSGTAGLHLAVKLAGVKRGDIVLCSDMTFSASANPIVYEGGVPVRDFPIKFRIKMNNLIVETEEWRKVEDLKLSELLLLPASEHAFTLEWNWAFEGGNDENDTLIGADGGKISLVLHISAQIKG